MTGKYGMETMLLLWDSQRTKCLCVDNVARGQLPVSRGVWKR